MSYGFCRCGAKITSRTRGIPSKDTCENGHQLDARLTLNYDPTPGVKDKIPEENGIHMPFGFPIVKLVSIQEPKDEKEAITLAEYLSAALRNEGSAHEPNSELKQDKFVSPCSPPTAYQNELLDILIEECAEVIHRATKMKRFGVEEIQEGQNQTNAERLSEELGDVSAMVELVEEAGMISISDISNRVPIKLAKLKKYLQNVPEAA